MGNGWIKLHRKLQLKGFYLQSQYVHLWIHLLLSANHAQKEYMTNGNIILIKAGQLLTGRKQLAQGTGIPESTIERILELLESEHQIEQQKTTKYRLITIVNWDEHQKMDSTSDSQRTASGHKQEYKERKNNTSEALLRVVPDEEKPQKPNKRVKDKEAVFSLFGRNEPWMNHTTQRESALRLFDRGLDKLKRGLEIMREHADDGTYCPQAYTPHEYEAKIPKLNAYIKKNNL